MHPLSEKEKSP